MPEGKFKVDSPDQKSSSVPTEKPLQLWNMILNESVDAGTTNSLEGSLLVKSEKSVCFQRYIAILPPLQRGGVGV